MPRSMRVVMGFMLGTMGVLGAMVGPARARLRTVTNGRDPELAAVIGSECGVEVSLQRISDVRTYRDLVDTISTCLDRRVRPIRRSLPVRSRIVTVAPEGGSLERVEELTPYALELIGDDAARAGRGARLEVTLPASAAGNDVAAVEAELARLSRRGIHVSVRRDAAWEVATIARGWPRRLERENGRARGRRAEAGFQVSDGRSMPVPEES